MPDGGMGRSLAIPSGIPAYAGMTVGGGGNDGRGAAGRTVRGRRDGGKGAAAANTPPLRHISLGDLAVDYGLVGGVIDGVLFIWGQAEVGKDRGVNLAAGVGQGRAETAFGAPVAAPGAIPGRLPSFPAPYHHSRPFSTVIPAYAGIPNGNEKTIPLSATLRGIPAYAGMTVGGRPATPYTLPALRFRFSTNSRTPAYTASLSPAVRPRMSNTASSS